MNSAELRKDLRQRIRFRLALSPAAHRLREASSASRMLPDFVIVGAQKAGTTFLHNLLSMHPQVLEPWRKEIGFFSFYYAKGESWYRAHFPRERKGSGLITGESTTNYMFHPTAAERIAKMVPDAKIVFLLREPSSRAWSHYRMNIDRKDETLSFREAIESEDKRMAGEAERLIADPSYEGWPYRLYSYRSRGRYLEQILRFEQHFPKENILVMDSKVLFKQPEKALVQVEKLLGLTEWVPNEFTPENVGKGSEKPDPETVAYLKDYFKPYDEALFDHLGWKPAW